MNTLETLFLAVVQAITEFLPVSSSGHLAILQSLFKTSEQGVALTVGLHAGTLCSVVVYYRKELLDLAHHAPQAFGISRSPEPSTKSPSNSPFAMTDAQRKILLCGLLLGTVVTAIVGLLLKDKVELFSLNMTWVGIFLLVSGCANFLTTWCAHNPKKNQRRIFGHGEVAKNGSNLRIRDAAWIGLAQGLAVVPGLSRSGTTIAAGVALGLEREFAARFSFLLSIPAITGATLLYAREFSEIPSPGLFVTSIGLSFLVGLGALHLLISVLKKGRFGIFAGYCWCLGLILIGLNLADGN